MDFGGKVADVLSSGISSQEHKMLNIGKLSLMRSIHGTNFSLLSIILCSLDSFGDHGEVNEPNCNYAKLFQ